MSSLDASVENTGVFANIIVFIKPVTCWTR